VAAVAPVAAVLLLVPRVAREEALVPHFDSIRLGS